MRRAIAVHHRGHWPEDAAVDSVTLPYLDRHRRRIRLIADSGQAFLLDLPRAHHLAEGDGLELEDGSFLQVRAAPEPIFEIDAN
jgi:urease accessory protein